MNPRVKELSTAARELNPDDLADLVGDLLDALERAEGWDEAWGNEARQRLAAYRRGELAAIPAADVLRQLGKQ